MKRTMLKFMLVVPLVFLSLVSAFAQAPEVVWSNTYGDYSSASSLHELPNGDLVLGGYIIHPTGSDQDMYIVRTDYLGDTLWTRAIGVSYRTERGNWLYPTADGGFILAGNIADEGYSNLCLVKTDEDGITEWLNGYGYNDHGLSGVAVVPSTLGYLAVGYFWNETTGYDLILIGTDPLGNQQWVDHLPWGDADYPTGLTLTGDFGFAVTGYTQSFDTDYDYDMFILGLGPTGVEAWSRSIGASAPFDESASHICHTSDGGFLLCGYRRETGSGQKDIYVVKTNSSGFVEWSSVLGGTYHDVGWSCIETVDGGYAVAASWYRNGNWQVGLIKYNSVGDTTWTSFWGDPDHGHTPYGLVQTFDNGYAVGGIQSGDTARAFMVKFAPEPGFDPFFFHTSELNLQVYDGDDAADSIFVDVTEKDLAGRSVIGVKVTIDTLEHPAVEELTITLRHEGTEITLVSEGDATGANFTGTVLSDASKKFLCEGLAPYTGSFCPNEQLNTFDDLDPNGYWIISVSDGTVGNDGTLRAWSITLLTDVVVGVADDEGDGPLPDFHLSQCYPNPFNPSTTIKYSLPVRSEVSIEIFNTLGQKITSLVNETKPAGEYRVTWDGTNSAGNKVSTGIYFYRLRAGDVSESKKMLLLK